jgi:hypothetical protein
MHGVAPHMCRSSSAFIVRRRIRGSLPRYPLRRLVPTPSCTDAGHRLPRRGNGLTQIRATVVGAGMGIVIQLRRPIASPEVVAKLIELGYLRPAKRHKAGAVENAMERLRHDLYRDGVIRAGDLWPASKEDGQERDQPPPAVSSSAATSIIFAATSSDPTAHVECPPTRIRRWFIACGRPVESRADRESSGNDR